MLKFNSNILKLKLFYLKILGKINKNNFKINTANKDIKVEKILIIFPIEEENFNVAKFCFRNLQSHHDINYIYLINNIFYSSSHFTGTTYGFSYLNKKKKIMINENFENDNIINKKFDVLIDLNCKFYFDIAMLVNKIKSNYKIGFKNDFSDLFYNVQFEPHTLEAGYNKINSMLQ